MERNSSTNQLILTNLPDGEDTSVNQFTNYNESTISSMPTSSLPVIIAKTNSRFNHSPTRRNEHRARTDGQMNDSYEIPAVEKDSENGMRQTLATTTRGPSNESTRGYKVARGRLTHDSLNSKQLGSSDKINSSQQIPNRRNSNECGPRTPYNKRPLMEGNCRKILRTLKVNLLLVLTIVGVTLGCILGFSLRTLGLNHEIIELIEFPGTIFMNLIKMLVVPLLVSSVVASISNMEGNTFDRIGLRTLLYFMATTVISVSLGIILSVTIKPGLYYAKSPVTTVSAKQASNSQTMNYSYPLLPQDENLYSLSDDIMDLFRNMFTDNIFRSAFETVRTVRTNLTHTQIRNISQQDEWETDQPKKLTAPANFKYIVIKRLTYSKFPNVLGLITASVATGVVMQKAGSSTRLLVDFFNAVNIVLMKLVGFVLWYSPLGIMSLITASILTIDDINSVFTRLGMFVLTVVTGLSIHSFVILPLLYAAFTKKNPISYIRNINQALLTAFGTASSAAALPITMDCSENKNGIDERISRLVLPLGATINMDGTGLYEATVALFVAQVNSIRLSVGQMIAVSLFAASSSVGAAAIPSAGIVTLALVLTAVNLPLNDLTFILSVDWLLDRLRTMTNVLGDSIGAGIVAHLSRKDLPENNDLNNTRTSHSPFRNSLLDDNTEGSKLNADDADINVDDSDKNHPLPTYDKAYLKVKKTRKHSTKQYHQSINEDLDLI